MPQAPQKGVSILPATQTSGGSLKEPANQFRNATQDSKDAKHWSTLASALANAQSQIDHITNALRRDLPQASIIQITDQSGALVAQIGNMVDVNNVSYPGIWAKDLYVGGSGPSTAVIIANDSGVVINGATIILNSNGIITTIQNAASGTTGWPGQASSLISTDIASGNYSEIDPFHIAIAQGGAPVVYMENVGGDGLLVVSRNPSTGQSVTIDGAAPLITVANGGVSSPIADLDGGDLSFTEAVGGHITDISRFSLTITHGAQTTTITAANVDSPGFSAGGVPGITSNLSYGSSLSVSTGSALTSATGPGVTGTTSGTFVTGVSLTLSTDTWTHGLLTA